MYSLIAAIDPGRYGDLGALFIQRETAIIQYSFNFFLLDLSCRFEAGWSSCKGGAWAHARLYGHI